MDLVAIFEHKKTADELLSICDEIDGNTPFINAIKKQYPNSPLIGSKWNGPNKMTSENLIRIWEIEEAEGEVTKDLEGLNYYAEIDIPYAELKFHRRTVSISPHGLHKYGNLKTPVWAEFIININRKIARIFGASKIVYCVDSYEDTEAIYSKSLTGTKIEEIIKYGNMRFGIPSKDIKEAINNYYFIDEFEIDNDEEIKAIWQTTKEI